MNKKDNTDMGKLKYDTINDLTKKGKKYHIKRLDRIYKILQFLKGISINYSINFQFKFL